METTVSGLGVPKMCVCVCVFFFFFFFFGASIRVITFLDQFFVVPLF